MTEAKAKKFNWKKAVTVFFGVVLIARVLMWLFASPVPTCNEMKVVNKLNSIVRQDLNARGVGELDFKFSKFKTVSSEGDARTCKAVLTITEDGEEVDEAIRYFDINKSGNGWMIKLN